MKRRVKASPSGSIVREVFGLRRIAPGTFAARGFSSDVRGTGAPPAGHFVPSVIGATVGVAILLICAAPANAGKAYPFKETFGSAAQPTFGNDRGIAIYEATGDVYVMDATSPASIKRFNPDGTPDDFSELGTNVIDGKAGADLTPQNGLGFAAATESQIAVDNSGGATDGNIYVTQGSPNVIQIFASTGAFLGQLTAAGTTSFTEACGVAVDPAGAVYVGDWTAGIKKFVPAANPPVNADHAATFTTTSQPCTLAAGRGATAGFLFAARFNGALSKIDSATGELKYTVSTNSHRTVFTHPATGHVFAARLTGASAEVAEYDASGPADASQISSTKPGATVEGIALDGAVDHLYVSRAGTSTIDVFGPPVPLPDATTKAASNVTGSTATLNGSVNPLGVEVTECKYEYGLTTTYGQTKSCEGSIPTDSNDHAVTAAISGLQPDGTTYHYRLVVDSANGEAKGADRTLVTSQTVFTEVATAIADTSATLNGTVRPEGQSLTDCFFEYGTTTLYGESQPCSPAAGSIPDDFDAHAVSAAITGLEPNATYHFRLVKTNASGTSLGQRLTFTTQGPPQIVEQRPLNVSQTSAILRAKINPAGKATHYHFEWGEGTAHDNRIPAQIEQNLAAGTDPVTVIANVAGLSPETAYSFRIVATNSYGSSVGENQPFETLNEFDLPNQRAFELVTPADKRPVGNLEQLGLQQQYFQAAASGDRIGYLILNGLDDSPSGGEVVYAGSRTDEGWSSSEITPPALVPAPEGGLGHYLSAPGFIRYMDPYGLRCALVETHNPLTGDTPAASVEFGVYNLYRWNSDGTYTLITNEIPLNPSAVSKGASDVSVYKVAGVSEDCSQIFFHSEVYAFPVDESTSTGLYEWNEADGVLRDAGLRPDGSVPSTTGFGAALSPAGVAAEKNSVARDGSFFFTATSNEGADSGKSAIFARKGPGNVVNVSQPIPGAEKATLGARYVGASPDGSSVFFLANCGIAASSCAGRPSENCSNVSVSLRNVACELYAYDLGDGTLSHISTDPNPADTKGAVVQAPMAFDDDGSVVYFAARGQLIPDRGRTYTENLAGSGHANVYRYDAAAAPAEALTYVGSLTGTDVSRQATILANNASNGWSSQTTSDGAYFLYGSRDDLTVNNANGVEAVRLFAADTGLTDCISCPADGSAPKPRPFQFELGIPAPLPGVIQGANVQPVSLSDDGRAIFSSEDALAPGAIEGQGEIDGALVKRIVQNNVYEWNRGQLSTLAIGTVEAVGMGGPHGRDVFIKSYEQLSGQDFDFAGDIYDLRSGGGFPPPPEAPEPCDPSEGACQGPPSDPPGVSTAASSSFRGEGNLSAGGAGNSCIVPARRAQRLAKRAKALRRKANRVSGSAATRRLARRARQTAKAASRSSRAAKRCRRARAANNDRGGVR